MDEAAIKQRLRELRTMIPCGEVWLDGLRREESELVSKLSKIILAEPDGKWWTNTELSDVLQ